MSSVGPAPFPDWQPAPNIRRAPGLYELENEAIDPEGGLEAALRRLAPWVGRVVVDLGCGTGFWVPRYLPEAARVLGVEPDAKLRETAEQRVAGLADAQVLAGSAELLPFEDHSVDVVHARFAYFWGPGAERGLQEATRALVPGGSFVAIDNDHRGGEFADLLRDTGNAFTRRDQDLVDGWWARRGATKTTVVSEWRFRSRGDLAAVLHNEFPSSVADDWLSRHADRSHITYHYNLFSLRTPTT